jgi:hypothetical protein
VTKCGTHQLLLVCFYLFIFYGAEAMFNSRQEGLSPGLSLRHNSNTRELFFFLKEGEIMGRQVKQPKIAPKKKCITCEKEFPLEKFYLSNNEFHKSDNRFPVCKICINNQIDYNNLETVYDILTQMNRPFLSELWNRSIVEANKTNREIFGTYYKNVILNHKTLTWKNSQFEKQPKESNSTVVDGNTQKNFIKNEFKFNVTEEMIMRWGSNYETDDYIKLEDFYHKMKLSNRIETPQEETYLKKLAVISLKMDQELEAGNYGQVKQLGDLFSKYMADSKFRAMDKTEADKTGGIRNFGTIFAEVEKDGHIPPWEEYRKIKGLTQDIVDKTIMHIENFTLRLNRVERMTEPPEDTPKLTKEDTDMLES